MEASDEAEAYVNVNPRGKSFSTESTGKASFRTYRMVAVSFGVLCVLQATLNITLRLHANRKSDVQTNISLLFKEKNQLQNNYTSLLMDKTHLQRKLEDAEGKLSKCIHVNNIRPSNFSKEENQLEDDYNKLLTERQELLQQLANKRNELSVAANRLQDLQSSMRSMHRENYGLQKENSQLRSEQARLQRELLSAQSKCSS
ncbi:uncharacterized protein LOC128317585 [Pangasianodon hypophthalmus]|uniref:uncharacterized protein LOC128317585 n=1 Tax=Pangasianodon hypophthalmus TaxID=310915 RepID=UPI000EFE40E1|nr:uncharacterized protein LOC128317585 [Pangasianodon hypophthalmus]